MATKHVHLELVTEPKRKGWSVSHTAELVQRFVSLIEGAYDCKAKDRTYYFWMVMARRLRNFFTTDPAAKYYKLAAEVQDQVQGGAYYKVEPFEHALDAAIMAWKVTSRKLISASDMLEIECRLACSFSAVVDIVAKQKVRPWDIKSYVYSDENKPVEGGIRPRPEDVLFWTRFFGDFQTKVSVERLSTALWLHIRLVEHQEVNVSRQIFEKLVKSTIGVGDGDAVSIEAPSEKSPHTFMRFIKKFGPTLDKVFAHMCGATLASGSLCSWLNYDFDTEKATAFLESSGDDGKPARNFIIRLARDKESFVIHYWMTQNDEESDEQVKLQVSKLSLDEDGYFAPSKKPVKYPTLREVLLRHVCKEYDYENEATQLDAEKLDWAGQHRVRRTQSTVKGNDSSTEQAELLANLWRFLEFEEDPFGKLVRELSSAITSNDVESKLFEDMCGYLDQDMNGELDSNETLIGIYMVLEPVLGIFNQSPQVGVKLQPEDMQQQLLELLPDQFVDGTDLAGFRALFGLTVAKLYFFLMRYAKSSKHNWTWENAELELFVSSVKQSIKQRIEEMEKQGGLEREEENEESSRVVYQYGQRSVACPQFANFFILLFFFPLTLARSIVYPKYPTQVNGLFKHCLLFSSRFAATVILTILLGFLYYSPLVSLIMYHVKFRLFSEHTKTNDNGISSVEAWAPFTLALMLLAVMGFGGAVHRHREKNLFKRRWLNAALIIRGSSKSHVTPKVLTQVNDVHGRVSTLVARQAAMNFDAVKEVFGNRRPLMIGLESRAYAQFGQTVGSYFEGFVGKLRILIAVGLSVGCAMLPGLFRVARDKKFFGTQYFELFITLIYFGCTLVGSSAVLIFIQGSALHYNSIRHSLSNAIALTEPRKAKSLKFSHYFPMEQPENVEYWILLRDAVKRQVDPSMDTVVAVALLLDVTMLAVLVVRIVVFKNGGTSFDLTNSLCVYVLICITGYLLQFIYIVVQLNVKVKRDTMYCLEGIKLRLALEINKVEKVTGIRDGGRKDGRSAKATAAADVVTDNTLRDLRACNLIVESALSSMENLDRPVKVLGITIDTAFVVKLLSLIGAGIGPVVVALARRN